MNIKYGKTLSNSEVVLINKLANECGIMFDTARLLYYRNIDTIDKVKAFLQPSINNLHNPFLFNDMQKVVDRINLAKSLNQTILICGDYDADGICATTILYYSLIEMGIMPLTLIPERVDGYGLNYDNVMQIHAQTPIDLIITVDCGISEKETIESFINQGIDVIVTDHHEPPEDIPNTLIINPKSEGENYPFDGLCGGGVAYKLACALIGKNANKYLDFVAIATTADSMQLIGENRDIVYEGLKLFSPNNLRLAFKYLLDENQKQINTHTLLYQIAPRINAGGRMGDANSALKLFISSDVNEMYDNAVKLNKYNIARQTECEEVYRQARSIIDSNKIAENPIICVASANWNSGVIGIVSSKLVEHYNKPVIVFAEQEDKYKGSARSIDGVNIHKLITNLSDYLLTFGGHSQAAGLSLKKEIYNDFYSALVGEMNSQYPDFIFEKSILCDWHIDKPISLEFSKQINMLEPFGLGNRKPLFTTTVNQVKSMPLREDSPHYNFETNALQMLDFNGGNNVEVLSLPIDKKILFEVNYSVFRGNESVKGFVKNIFPEYNDYDSVSLYLFRDALLLLKNQPVESSFIPYDKNIIQKGYGTLYAINDYTNLINYVNPNLQVTPFYPQAVAGENCIVICPREIPESYKEVVYLDAPLQPINSNAKTTVVGELCGYEYIDILETDREFFATVFNVLNSLDGKEFYNSIQIYDYVGDGFDGYSFIFAVEVFLELGIFYIEKGRLKRNYTVKNALTNSTIYSKILKIKED